MRNIGRIYNFTAHFAELWAKYLPDWRFAQIINNMQSYYHSDLFYNEENLFMEKFERYIYEVCNNVDFNDFLFFKEDK